MSYDLLLLFSSAASEKTVKYLHSEDEHCTQLTWNWLLSFDCKIPDCRRQWEFSVNTEHVIRILKWRDELRTISWEEGARSWTKKLKNCELFVVWLKLWVLIKRNKIAGCSNYGKLYAGENCKQYDWRSTRSIWRTFCWYVSITRLY